MSEAGDIPASEPVKANSNDDDDDTEEGMIVEATAVVDDNGDDGSTGSLVVAKVVDDEDDSQPPKVTKVAPDVTDESKRDVKSFESTSNKEEGEVSPTKDAAKAGNGHKLVKNEDEPPKEEQKASPVPEAKEGQAATLPSASSNNSSTKTDKKLIKDGVTEKSLESGPSKSGTPPGNPLNENQKEIKPSESQEEGEIKEEASTNQLQPSESKEEGEVKEEGELTADAKVKDEGKAKEVKEDGEQEAKGDTNEPKTTVADNMEEDGDVEEGEINDQKVGGARADTNDSTSADNGPGVRGIDSTTKSEAKAANTDTQATEQMPMDVDSETPKDPSKESSDDNEAFKENAIDMDSDKIAAADAKQEQSSKTKDDTSGNESSEDKSEGKDAKVDSDEDGEIKEDTEEEGEVKEETEEEGEIKQDEEMEDALSQSEEGGDRDMDTASNDADTVSVDGDTSAAEYTKKVEPSYSTRGRASGTTTPVPRDAGASKGSVSSTGAGSDQWEKSVRDALDELGRGHRDTTPSGVGPGGASFLEALGEEERRTRTRFLPAVDGIHMLRKNEIKSDMALARSIMSGTGNITNVANVALGAGGSTGSKKSKSKKKQESSGDGDAMDVDDGSVSVSSEDATGERPGSSSTIEVEKGNHLALPSTVFAPPPAATQATIITPPPSGDMDEEGATAAPAPLPSTSVKGLLSNQRNIKSPKVVEAVTAFNPPRPPESVGKKKQHRMLRWERRPADVEIDLNNYRKTVDRTRKELHAAEEELERIESTSDHLRRHFMGHMSCLDREYEQIRNELNSVQQENVKAADLLTSRTRSRGAGKGSYVMRDVLTVLKARGAELAEKGIPLKAGPSPGDSASKNPSGLGGVGGSGFVDWNQQSEIHPQKIASAWVLPGDKVDTPYGEGVVLEVLKSPKPEAKEPAPKLPKNGKSPSRMDISTPASGEKAKGTAKSSKVKKQAIESEPTDISEEQVVGARISVKLASGVGYSPPSAVSSKENPKSFSDAQLAKRWKGLIESALSQYGRLDLEGMASVKTLCSIVSKDQGDDGETGGMDEDEAAPEFNESCDSKLLPFGSSLLPTGTGRADILDDTNAVQLQNSLKTTLIKGEGVLGTVSNEGVPAAVREFEDRRQESYILQARVLHLRNQLYRQRRIRTFNERTFTSTRERSSRVESLVAEMRTDLNSLRSRLDEELKELGIDEERAEEILKSYYVNHSYEQVGDDSGTEHGSSQKRSSAKMKDDNDDGTTDRQSKRVKVQ